MAKILLLEPDRIFANNYRRALVLGGHEVIWHNDAQAAINSVDKDVPDIIIVEPQIRGNNGIEFLYELRSYTDWKEIPVVILSLVPDYALSLSPRILEQLKIVDYLYKPQTSLEKLSNSIDNSLLLTIGK